MSQASVFLAGALAIEFRPRYELHNRRDAIDGHDGNLPYWIDSQAAPVRSADVRRYDQRSTRARRREYALVAQFPEDRAAGGAIGLGQGATPSGQNIEFASGAADDFSGTDAFNFTGNDPRARAISRDSQRQAKEDAAKQRLEAAVNEQSQQRRPVTSHTVH